MMITAATGAPLERHLPVQKNGRTRRPSVERRRLLLRPLHVGVEVFDEIVEIRFHHLAELVGEILQRPFLFRGHGLRAAARCRDDEGVEARRSVQRRCADFARMGRCALVVRHVDEGVGAIEEFRAGGVVTHESFWIEVEVPPL
jgi:hypothetical protein